jgi:serine/threonine-protein kinase
MGLPSAQSTLPQPGDEILGKYRVEEILGQGGMGVVYAARHGMLKQRVAMKFLRPEAVLKRDALPRFVREARAAASIESEHVARVLDAGVLDNGLPYMVLEYLHGLDLARLLGERGPLPVAQVADYLLQAIEGIAHAHALGIVHRDLKPSNLFLARRPDGSSRIKVLDFGISKAKRGLLDIDVELTRTNSVLGTPVYMAPEQLKNAKGVDHRADIWALGIIAYELLTGTLPFRADNALDLFRAIEDCDPDSLRGRRPELAAYPDLETMLIGCLRRERTERFQSVTELACALAAFGTHTGQRTLEKVKDVLPLGRAFRHEFASSPDENALEFASTLPDQDSGGTRVMVKGPVPEQESGPTRVMMVAPLSRDDHTTHPRLPRPAAIASSTLLSPGAKQLLGTWSEVISRIFTGGPTMLPRVWPQILNPPRILIGLGAFLATLVFLVSVIVVVGAKERPSATAAPVSQRHHVVAAPHALMEAPDPGQLVEVDPPAGAAPEVITATSLGPKRPPLATDSLRPKTPTTSCNPPYVLDSSGKRHWRLECLP